MATRHERKLWEVRGRAAQVTSTGEMCAGASGRGVPYATRFQASPVRAPVPFREPVRAWRAAVLPLYRLRTATTGVERTLPPRYSDSARTRTGPDGASTTGVWFGVHRDGACEVHMRVPRRAPSSSSSSSSALAFSDCWKIDDWVPWIPKTTHTHADDWVRLPSDAATRLRTVGLCVPGSLRPTARWTTYSICVAVPRLRRQATEAVACIEPRYTLRGRVARYVWSSRAGPPAPRPDLERVIAACGGRGRRLFAGSSLRGACPPPLAYYNYPPTLIVSGQWAVDGGRRWTADSAHTRFLYVRGLPDTARTPPHPRTSAVVPPAST
ncbi:hypothetical protein BC628DRAFT_1366318 [Trametes gibbosa]|nr:hypothetical protein BC628DRAFT_1366318 [Trametes gibbosa]